MFPNIMTDTPLCSFKCFKPFNNISYPVVNELQEVQEVMSSLNLNSDDSRISGTTSTTRSTRHFLRNQTNNDARLHGVQNHAITKKRFTTHNIKDIKPTEPKQLQKLYFNKFKAFHSTSLETIFEQCESVSDTEVDAQLTSKRKLNRRIVFSDGMKATKALQKKRRHRIEVFGLQKKFPKLKLEQVMEYLNEATASTEKDIAATPPNKTVPIDCTADLMV